MRNWGILLVSIMACAVRCVASEEADALQRGFVQPPASARPWVYYFLMDGNISRAGITADLEAMRDAGIGGAVLFDVTQGMPEGSVKFDSPEWHQLFAHIVTEARRCGLEIFVQNSAGWTGSGGPWISSELSMQMLISTRTNLTGPSHFNSLLVPPVTPSNTRLHVATIAFPTLVGEGAAVPDFAPKITASAASGFNGHSLVDREPKTWSALPLTRTSNGSYIQFEFERPYTAGYFKLSCYAKPQAFEGRLEVSDDGKRFRPVREFINRNRELRLEFEQVTARFYRWSFTQAQNGPAGLDFSEIEIAPVWRLPVAAAKAGLGALPSEPERLFTAPHAPSFCLVNPSNVIELTSQRAQDGRLNWDVPPGDWTVLEFWQVPNLRTNHPAREGGRGLECDKLSKVAIRAQFTGFVDKLVRDAGTNTGSSFAGLHVDSWEIGYQNWTPLFRDEFKRRRNYDLLPFLPATTGRIVGSPEISERFLWDMRRTIADLQAENYASELARMAHERGLRVSFQGYGSLGAGPFDDLLYGGAADIPMAEFWLEGRALDQLNLKGVPSAAHTSGKAIVGAEAFTSYPPFAKWQNHPFSLKPLADAVLCEGVNRLVFHRYVHQPWLGQAPGLTLGPFGLHYERTETWWSRSREWHAYLARCQSLLQRGLFVADVCYVTEEAGYTRPPAPEQLQPPPVYGFDYDLIAPRVVLEQMQVKDGRLTLPDGMSYRLLVMPSSGRVTPRLLGKIKQLVRDGATVLGPRPTQSPSLVDYPQCDESVAALAKELWGSIDGRSIQEHTFGHGRVLWGQTLEQALSDSKDFEQSGTWQGYRLRYVHRRDGDADIYFVANVNTNSPANGRGIADCRFRVGGKLPEIWHPDTGQIETAAAWREEASGTVVPLSFGPAESTFIVFRRSAQGADPVVNVRKNGGPWSGAQPTRNESGASEFMASEGGTYSATTLSGKVLTARVASLPVPLELKGAWELRFPAESGAPPLIKIDRLMSWTEITNPPIKYFSGTATYTKRFSLPQEFIQRDRKVLLDLGRVQVMAEVLVNGTNSGSAWKPPFIADITHSVHAGDNVLELQVVNLWPNRLIGDEQLPDDCEWLPVDKDGGQPLARWPVWLLKGMPRPSARKAFVGWKHWKKDSALLESGLLGPVILRTADRVELR